MRVLVTTESIPIYALRFELVKYPSPDSTTVWSIKCEEYHELPLHDLDY
jgi:hypothetical protein